MTAHLVQPPASGFDGLQTATLASLPETFRAAPNGFVRLVDGGPGWAQRAIEGISGGARALIVDRPSADPSEQVRRLRDVARAGEVPVAVNSPYVGSATWVACRDGLLSDAVAAGLVDSMVVVREPPELERGMLAQIAVVRPLLQGVTLRRLFPGSTTLVTRGSGIAASLNTTVSRTPGMVLDLVGAAVRWRVELPDDGTARAGRATRHDAIGETTLRPIYSTASRSTWQALAGRLRGHPGAFYDLDDLLLDLEVLERA